MLAAEIRSHTTSLGDERVPALVRAIEDSDAVTSKPYRPDPQPSSGLTHDLRKMAHDRLVSLDPTMREVAAAAAGFDELEGYTQLMEQTVPAGRRHGGPRGQALETRADGRAKPSRQSAR